MPSLPLHQVLRPVTAPISPILLRIVYQDDTTYEHSIVPGWNYLTGPLGAQLYVRANDAGLNVYCLRLGNDVGDSGMGGPGSGTLNDYGTVYFKRIEIVCSETVAIVPRYRWSVQDNDTKIVVGDTNTNQCIPPRSSLRIRWCSGTVWTQILNLPTPLGYALRIGNVMVPLPAAWHGGTSFPNHAQDLADNFYQALATGGAQYGENTLTSLTTGPFPSAAGDTVDVGIWRPHYDNHIDNEDGGGHGICPFPWERVAETILYHDAAAERHAVGWRQRANGRPVVNVPVMEGSQSYDNERSWVASSVPDLISNPHPLIGQFNVNSDDRIARKWNVGTCGYEWLMAGFKHETLGSNNGGAGTDNSTNGRSQGFPAHYGSHMVRCIWHGRTAAEIWGDECAADDLKMYARDAQWAWPLQPGVYGSGHAGAYLGRAYAWAIEIMTAGGESTHAGIILQAALLAQMSNGLVQRITHATDDGSPSPWSDTHGSALEWGHDAAQCMEGYFLTYVFARMRKTTQASNVMNGIMSMVTGQPGYIPKHVAVADTLPGSVHNLPFIDWTTSSITHPPWGYFHWIGTGVMAHVQPAGDVWLQSMLRTPTPGGYTPPSTGSIAERLQALADYLRAPSNNIDVTGRGQLAIAMSALEAAGY